MPSPVTQNVSSAAATVATPAHAATESVQAANQQRTAEQATRSDAPKATAGIRPRERTAPRTPAQVEGQFGSQTTKKKESRANSREEPEGSTEKRPLDVVA